MPESRDNLYCRCPERRVGQRRTTISQIEEGLKFDQRLRTIVSDLETRSRGRIQRSVVAGERFYMTRYCRCSVRLQRAGIDDPGGNSKHPELQQNKCCLAVAPGVRETFHVWMMYPAMRGVFDLTQTLS